ncbi:MAG: hypothetical protein ACLFSQ_08020 [Candidatus Zixiibacteriota bacterium]
MKARGFIGTFLITAIIVAFICSSVFLLIESYVTDLSIKHMFALGIWTRNGFYIGVSFGIAFGLVNASSLRNDIIYLPFDDKATFLMKIINILVDIGYHPKNEDGDHLVFKPSDKVVSFAGRIEIETNEYKAKIQGPKVFLARIKRLYNETNSETPHTE